MLCIHNSFRRKKEVFTPLSPDKVNMYVCGMTVYDFCHMGHARVLVVFDIISRFLRAQGFDVTYVRNITDIDDKIIKRAKENDEPWEALTERFIGAMNEDCDALGVLAPDHEPRATDSIELMVRMIQTLVDKGHAYVADNGDVNYSVESFEAYGCLSNKKLDELQVGARVDVDKSKRSPLDFVLWKSAKPDEPSWSSPWGDGRPGWHIECSAMSTSILGDSFDIHGGGCDLVFPHHENEIAQSEGATGKPFVGTWIHAGFLQVNEEKMSKSLGNFFTIRDVLKQYDGETIRFFLLSSHYRSPLNYSDKNLSLARHNVEKLYTALDGLYDLPPLENSTLETQFVTAMEDDFNTPEAIAVLFEIAKETNKNKHDAPECGAQYGALLKKLANVLGILEHTPYDYFQHTETLDVKFIQELIDKRDAARNSKNWVLADKLRDDLQNQGIQLEDKNGKTQWKKIKG